MGDGRGPRVPQERLSAPRAPRAEVEAASGPPPRLWSARADGGGCSPPPGRSGPEPVSRRGGAPARLPSTQPLARRAAVPGWSAGRARLTLNQDKRRRFDSYPGSHTGRACEAGWRPGDAAPPRGAGAAERAGAPGRMSAGSSGESLSKPHDSSQCRAPHQRRRDADRPAVGRFSHQVIALRCRRPHLTPSRFADLRPATHRPRDGGWRPGLISRRGPPSPGSFGKPSRRPVSALHPVRGR